MGSGFGSPGPAPRRFAVPGPGERMGWDVRMRHDHLGNPTLFLALARPGPSSHHKGSAQTPSAVPSMKQALGDLGRSIQTHTDEWAPYGRYPDRPSGAGISWRLQRGGREGGLTRDPFPWS